MGPAHRDLVAEALRFGLDAVLDEHVQLAVDEVGVVEDQADRAGSTCDFARL